MTPGPPVTAMLVLVWALLATFALGTLVELSVLARPGAATDLVHLGAVEALVFVGGTYAVLRIHAPERPLPAALGLRAVGPTTAALAFALGFLVHFPAEAIDAGIEHFVPTPDEVLAARAAMLTADTPGRLVILVAVVACIGPLVEELFYRGALFGVLRRVRGAGPTLAAVSGAFVAAHLDVRAWPALVLVSVVLTRLREATGSLAPSLALHVGFNASTIAALAAGSPSGPDFTGLDLGASVAGTLGTIALVGMLEYLAARSPEARRSRDEDAS